MGQYDRMKKKRKKIEERKAIIDEWHAISEAKRSMNRFQEPFFKSFNFIELFIGVLIVFVICVLALSLVDFVFEVVIFKPSEAVLMDFLEKALTLVVGIEFVKMLCNHNPETIVEVLLFAIARHLIVEKQKITEMFVGVVCIAILFMIRKYLFVGRVQQYHKNMNTDSERTRKISQ